MQLVIRLKLIEAHSGDLIFQVRLQHNLDEDEKIYFSPLIENFKGQTQEFQRIMRDLGKFGKKIGEGSTFKVCREVQHLFDDASRKNK